VKTLKVKATYVREYLVEVPEELYQQAYQTEDPGTSDALFAIAKVDQAVTQPAFVFADANGLGFIDLEWEVK
jgi:hypothetical protein